MTPDEAIKRSAKELGTTARPAAAPRQETRLEKAARRLRDRFGSAWRQQQRFGVEPLSKASRSSTTADRPRANAAAIRDGRDRAQVSDERQREVYGKVTPLDDDATTPGDSPYAFGEGPEWTPGAWRVRTADMSELARGYIEARDRQVQEQEIRDDAKRPGSDSGQRMRQVRRSQQFSKPMSQGR